MFSLARRSGEPKIEPAKRVESDDWIKSIKKATTNIEPAAAGTLRATSGQRNLRNLPFSDRAFTEIARRFYVHDSIIRKVSRADVSEFSATTLEMGKSHGRALPANVYNIRTSNAWDQDLAVSATHFPHCGLTFAIMFGCTLSVEAEVLKRLTTATYEICHPLLVPSILVEIERKRHLPIVEDTLDELEARIQELDEDPESVQGIAEEEKVARKEAKRSAWLDMLYLRNQLMSWNTCLEALYKHTGLLNRTIFLEAYMRYQYRDDYTVESSDSEGSFSDSESDSNESANEVPLVDILLNDQTRGPKISQAVSEVPQTDFYQEPTSESLKPSKSHMRRTGTKIQGRLQEIIKDYNEKIRECTTGVE
ncbi:hypothetical protein IL306_005573, partial [Fusarium sp. DS 682]